MCACVLVQGVVRGTVTITQYDSSTERSGYVCLWVGSGSCQRNSDYYTIRQQHRYVMICVPMGWLKELSGYVCLWVGSGICQCISDYYTI
jgi:hypothetical protein